MRLCTTQWVKKFMEDNEDYSENIDDNEDYEDQDDCCERQTSKEPLNI